MANLLGTPLMPWQRLVADVALEVDPVTGLLAYRQIILTVPRQSGKTTLLLAVMVHRALGFGSKQRILYTAQTRNDARKKWEDEHVNVLEASPLKPMFRVRKSNGSEAIRWKNGSMHGITSTTEKAGHGETLDMGVEDEAFALDSDRVEQAMRPAMITRPQPQLWVVSTAGTERSTYLRGKVETGRQRVRDGLTETVAYFEWSAPDDADPRLPGTWWACMPALGHTVTERAIKQELESMKLSEFRRAYLNQWPEASRDEWCVIEEDAWQGCADPGSQPMDPVAFAADVRPDRQFASVAVAGRREDGRLHVEVVERSRGVGWVVGRLLALSERWTPCAVVIDGAGPAGSLIAAVEAGGIEVTKPSARDATQACGQFYDAVTNRGLAHMDQPELSRAVAGALKRPLGDAWAWNRRDVDVDISPLVAATLAAWGFTTRGHLVEPAPFFAASWR